MNEYKTIYNLVIYDKDLGKMKWKDAIKACEDLGNGWRLPTKDELILLFENKDVTGDFGDRSYWSSSTKKGISRFIFSNSFFVDFKRGSCFEISQDRDLYVRPVRTK
jgi:hypothetical protein